jgi:arylformamidase
MRIIDISQPILPATAVWPGDTPFTLSWTLSRKDGASVNLSAITLSPHTGTHADAPLHIGDDGSGAGELDLAAFMGPARVIAAVPDARGLIPPSAFDGLDVASRPRVLIKTGTGGDGRAWPAGFAGLSPEAARRLVEEGARLVGLDTPSVDPEASTTLDAHHILLEGGLVWLESLMLAHVDPGSYELIALPLRLVGCDASPVRAVLIG